MCVVFQPSIMSEKWTFARSGCLVGTPFSPYDLEILDITKQLCECLANLGYMITYFDVECVMSTMLVSVNWSFIYQELLIISSRSVE